MTDAIEQLAHSLWENAGRPEGRDMEFWLAAEQLVVTDGQRPAKEEKRPLDDEDVLYPAVVIGGD